MGSVADGVTSVAIREDADIVRAEDFFPVFTVKQAVDRKKMMNQFINEVLSKDTDYGEMPGGQKKSVLMKPGAEKLCSIFGLVPTYVKEVIVEDWTGAEHGGEPLFSYEYRCQLRRGGRLLGEAIGSCNSWESKYRYRWVGEDLARQREDFDRLPKRGGRISEPKFAIDKAETSGKYGKPATYWQAFKDAIAAGTATEIQRETKTGKPMQCWEIDSTLYRIQNPEIADVVNTCQKMAQKRALVAAVLVVTNCSDAFTQDVEDFADHDEPVIPAKPASIPPASGRPVPEHLAPVFAAIDKDSGRIKGVLADIEKEMCRLAGKAGIDEYNRVVAAFREKFPKGTELSKAQIKDCILDLHEAIEGLAPIQEEPDVAATQQ